ncbi:acetate uptake transporter [Streptomyces boninensis]|uniref:acetate uptake transporter n=1 Tax=Streptomyces boninensis TaxID=2039455 RepID=UPI003B21A326
MDKDVSAGSTTSSLGYLLLGLTLLSFGLVHTDVISGTGAADVTDLALYVGGVALFVTGLLELRSGQSFTGTAFAGLGAFWFTWASAADASLSANAAGLFLLMWAVLALSLAFASASAGRLTEVVYGLLFISLLLMAIGSLADAGDLSKIGGWAAAVSGATSWYVATSALAGWPASLPRRAADREVTVPG